MKIAAIILLMLPTALFSTRSPGLDNASSTPLGLDETLIPATAVIEVEAGEQPIDKSAEVFSWEYWLRDGKGGNTGCMTFGDNTYKVYKTNKPCPATAAKDIKISETARRCMRQSSDTLKAILLDPHPEITQFVKNYGKGGRFPFTFYGWVDDYHSLQSDIAPGKVRQGPFNWKASGAAMGQPNYKPDGFVKWHSVLLADGTCMSPSLGQFLRLLKQMGNCTSNPGPACKSV